MTHTWDQLEGVSLAGEYALQQCLGSDQSGAFFLTTFGTEQRQAVIKLVAADTAAEYQLLWWQKTARLAHPNLLTMLDCGRTDTPNGPFLYAVFEYPDDNVASALQHGPLSEAEAREVLSAVVEGLRYIHEQGMVHGAIDAHHVVAVGERIQLSTDTVRECVYEDGRAEDVRAVGSLIHELLTTRVIDDGAIVELTGIGEPLRTIVRELTTPEGGRRWTLDEIAGALHPQSAPPVTVGIAPVVAAETAPPPEPETLKPVLVMPPPVPPPAPPPKERALALPLLIPAVAAVVVAVVLAVVHKSPAEPPAREVTTPTQVPVTQAAQTIPSPKPSPVGAQPVESVQQGAWRVIAYTFSAYQDAARKAKWVNEKWPTLGAEVFKPKSQARGPFLVAIGGRRTRSDAAALQRKARSQGLPRDTYIQNYSN